MENHPRLTGEDNMVNDGAEANDGPQVAAPHDHLNEKAPHDPLNEKAIFDNLLYPDDNYDGDVYWADLGLMRRFNFVNRVNNAEAAKELGSIGRMMRLDPLSPISFYFRNYVIPGAGLGLEGYAPQHALDSYS